MQTLEEAQAKIEELMKEKHDLVNRLNQSVLDRELMRRQLAVARKNVEDITGTINELKGVSVAILLQRDRLLGFIVEMLKMESVRTNKELLKALSDFMKKNGGSTNENPDDRGTGSGPEGKD